MKVFGKNSVSGNVGIVVRLFCALLLLPLLGIVLGEKPLVNYIQFPPRTQYVEHPGFSWPIFVGLLGFIIAVVAPFIARVIKYRGEITAAKHRNVKRFPLWGYFGLLITAITWVIAWNRFDFFAGIQAFTFTPLWLGYILVINAWTYRRTGHCMLIDRPRDMVMLFAASAVFWWYFEYLNRFVQNWHYRGIGNLSGFQYFI
ncbi:MAG: hypothetical protein JXN60_08880, partial [Lentisphaerae bacterium]|nr:hypothetical protein [Lentisphaerota bacterium]